MQAVLNLDSKWYDDGLQLAKWSDSSKKILSLAFFELREILLRNLSPYCMHIKGRGGVKGSVRCLYSQLSKFPFVGRFDVKSFYGSINHKILFDQLDKFNINTELLSIIKDYVRIPDTENKSMGIVAGGALSTLLGAFYLSTLDSAMHNLYKKGHIFYLHYSDDIVVLAKSRCKLKTAIKTIHKILESLKLQTHTQDKRFIGKTSKGFSFLGYFFKSGRKLRPSKESLNRFARRARQLYEQGALAVDSSKLIVKSSNTHQLTTINHQLIRLLSYAQRYYSYLHAGLKFSVTLQKLQKYLKFLDHKFGLYLSV